MGFRRIKTAHFNASFAVATAVWAATLLILHFAVRSLRQIAVFDSPRWWPFSVFNPRTPSVWQVVGAVGIALVAWGAWRWLRSRNQPVVGAAVIGTLLILATNALQGVPTGFVHPITGREKIGGIQYYHDALTVTDAGAFLRTFNTQQANLLEHGRTHPPGAILVFVALRQIFGDHPAVHSIALTIASAGLLAFGFGRLLRVLFPDNRPDEGILLLLCLPAVQIYGCATLDALIAGLLLVTVALFIDESTPLRTLGATLCLGMVSFLSFGFLWGIPLLVVGEWTRRPIFPLRLALVGVALLAGYGLLYALTGFHYLNAFRLASHLENPEGFRLLAEPLSYAMTRLENLAELAAFAGPVLLACLSPGLAHLRSEKPRAFALIVTAGATLVLLFLTGAFRTGETARACFFIWPYLVLPALTQSRERAIISIAFLQTLVMQLFGNWFW